MPDSIDLGRYSVFTPPDPFENHTGPFYFKVEGDSRSAGSVHCVLPTEARHANYAGGVHGGHPGVMTDAVERRGHHANVAWCLWCN